MQQILYHFHNRKWLYFIHSIAILLELLIYKLLRLPSQFFSWANEKDCSCRLWCTKPQNNQLVALFIALFAKDWLSQILNYWNSIGKYASLWFWVHFIWKNPKSQQIQSIIDNAVNIIVTADGIENLNRICCLKIFKLKKS